MFDFFKYMKDEMLGIDAELAYKERKEQQEREKEERYIFTNKAKAITIVMAAVYIMIAFLMIIALKNSESPLFIIQYIFKALIAVGVIISLLVGKKRGEIVALSGIALFIILLLVSVAFL